MRNTRLSALFTLFLAFAFSLRAEDKWVIKYSHEESKSTLTLTDLQFPSETRGVACGFELHHSSNILGDRETEKGVVLVTSNGGKTWSRVYVKEEPASIFFLDDSVGWMTTDSGIWLTEESGRSWRRIAQVHDIDRVYFLTRQHGFAIGPMKHVYESNDGGVKWEPVAAAASPDTTRDWTVYSSIAFADSKAGLITGFSHPPDRESMQEALAEPAREARRPELPHVSIFLDTKDGGKTWTPTTASLFGDITKTSLSPDGTGLGLVEFRGVFPWPSEVYRIVLKDGKSERAYREQNRAITDVLLLPQGAGFIAGYEPPGKLVPSPIPGKVKILRSADLENWEEMSVDYRAVATRVFLAAAGRGAVWAATDTGTILKLVLDTNK